MNPPPASMQQLSLQQQQQLSLQQQKQTWIPVEVLDVSGVKIYENVAFDESRRAVVSGPGGREHVASRLLSTALYPEEEDDLVAGVLFTGYPDENDLIVSGGSLETSYPEAHNCVASGGSLNTNDRLASGGSLNTSYLDEEEALMRMLSASLLDDSYEIVSVADQRVLARAHFRPRSLKYPL